jgi:uncharacterized RDD family membrane protein YckC
MDLNNPHLDLSEADIEAAPRWSRLAARIVDMLLWFAPLIFIFFPCLGPVIALLGWLVLLIAQIWMLVTRAQTLGKKTLNIYIIRSDGNIPHIGWLLVREFAIPVISGLLQYGGARHENPMDFMLLGLGSSLWLIDALFIFGPTRRCLHDYMAGTHVVKTV